MSIPLLAALSETRKFTEGVYSVTEILNPTQVVYLSRNFPFYATPESRIWMTLGTGWHKAMENGLKEMPADMRQLYSFEEENYFEKDFGFAKLRGQPDLYELHTKTLRDYKTMKVYTAKKLKNGDWEGSNYHWQLNMYRVFKFPETKRMILECVIKDWSLLTQEKDGIKPIELIDVPVIDDVIVENEAKRLLTIHYECQLNPSKVDKCTKEDVWLNVNPRSSNCGVPIRCRDYCAVNAICPQAQAWLKKNKGWKNAKK